jgi:hypothetical protein
MQSTNRTLKGPLVPYRVHYPDTNAFPFSIDVVTRARIRAPFDGEMIFLKHKVIQHH